MVVLVVVVVVVVVLVLVVEMAGLDGAWLVGGVVDVAVGGASAWSSFMVVVACSEGVGVALSMEASLDCS